MVEYQAGRYRAIDRTEAMNDPSAVRQRETGDHSQAVAQLRTPAVEVKARKGGQLSFFR